MEHEAVSNIVERISSQIYELDHAVVEKDLDKIGELCKSLDRLVKERANKLLILK